MLTKHISAPFIVSAFILSALCTTTGADAFAAEVTIIRGNKAEVVSTTPDSSGRVNVVRGGLGSGPEPRAPAQQPAAAPQRGAAAVSGENLWHVDRRGRVRACWLQGTGYVNSQKVVCTR